MDKYIKTDVDGLVKDKKSGAILNVDNTKLSSYKKQKEIAQKAVDSHKRIEKLENDMSDIKQMLQQLLQR